MLCLSRLQTEDKGQRRRRQVCCGGVASLPSHLAVVTDAGSASREQGNFVVREAVAALLLFWDSPFRQVEFATTPKAGQLSRVDLAGATVLYYVQLTVVL